MGVAKSRARRLAPACLLAGLLAGLPIAPPPARAGEVTDAQAQQLERRLHDWLADFVGAQAPLGERPLPVTAAGDHFELAIPFDRLLTAAGASVRAAPLTAQLRPLDDSRWSVDYTLPSPMQMSVAMPGQGTVDSTITTESQQNHAVLDLSLATTSSADSVLKGIASVARGPAGEQRFRIESTTTHAVAEPAGDRRVNLLADQDARLVTVNMTTAELGLVSFSAERARLLQHADAFAVDRLATILRSVFAVLPQLRAVQRAATDGAPKIELTADSRAALHAALQALGDLCSSFDQQVTIEDVHLQSAAFSGSVAKMSSGIGLAAPNGLLELTLHLGLDGLDSPSIPDGPLHDLVPHHIAVAPRLGGVPGQPALALLIRAVDSDGHDPALQADADALLQQGTVAMGLDELAFDIGPAQFNGQGAIQIADRDKYAGQAHVSASGLDALIRLASSTPQLQQALPVLIFLKGIGVQDGDKTVWDITWQDHRILVNGADMSHMLPGK